MAIAVAAVAAAVEFVVAAAAVTATTSVDDCCLELASCSASCTRCVFMWALRLFTLLKTLARRKRQKSRKCLFIRVCWEQD